jgi:hypothetical protein
MVLHGNYPYSNLFEQNDGQNMVIDNSHGANGPHNTYFRNRGALYGIFFSDNSSPNQNLVGNEITNTASPMSAVNYTIQGTGHFVYGNNNKGTISPLGTNDLPDTSFYFSAKPASLPLSHYASIGAPNALNSGSIPATYYYQQGDLFANACGYISDLSIEDLTPLSIKVFPNPLMLGQELQIEGDYESVQVLNPFGQLILENKQATSISLENIERGVYFLRFIDMQKRIKLVKISIVD